MEGDKQKRTRGHQKVCGDRAMNTHSHIHGATLNKSPPQEKGDSWASKWIHKPCKFPTQKTLHPNSRCHL